MKSKWLNILIVVLTVSLLAGCSMELKAESPYISPSSDEQLKIEMIAEVEDSVVVVKTDTGHGSGIIFRADDLDEGLFLYYVLTNYHVVEDGGEMRIHFGDVISDIFARDYVGYEEYDIAIVRFETEEILRVHHVAPIDDNTTTEIIKGQDVFAIGTPDDINKFNYVTQGIVSLVSYPYNGVPGLALMHDAAINPGNSGGPLFNLNGDLIGINVAKVGDVSSVNGSLSSEGLGFALSINTIASKINSFLESEYISIVRKAKLGVTIQEVSAFIEENDALLLPSNPVGVVVIDFDLSRNAHLVLEVYDLIVEMNGIAITSIPDVAAQLQDAKFGDSHQLTVMRKSGNDFILVTVTIILS
jgi:serine protease Do